MTTYFKAIQPDGTDFFSGTVQWAPPEGHEGEWVVTHPMGVNPDANSDTGMEYVLCASTEPADCAGLKWPCRLLLVEPTDNSGFHHFVGNKVRGTQFRVVGERPAHEALGPNGEQVAQFIEVIRSLTPGQWAEVDAAWDAALDAARGVAWDAARGAALGAARDAALGAAWGAALDAALAYVVRDIITADQFEALVKPFWDAGIELP